MKTNESKVARQYSLKQWSELIRAGNDRPTDLSIKDWYNQNDITPANYYYRLREVCKACLVTLPQEQMPQQLVPIPTNQTSGIPTEESFLEIVVDGACIRVTNHTSPELLSMVLQVALPMLNDATCFKNVYIVTGYTDLRSGIDTLASRVESLLGSKPCIPD